MPIYEFECNTCKKKFELLVRSNAASLACPECNGKKLTRLISTFAFTSQEGPVSLNESSSSGCSGCTGGDCSSCGH